MESCGEFFGLNGPNFQAGWQQDFDSFGVLVAKKQLETTQQVSFGLPVESVKIRF